MTKRRKYLPSQNRNNRNYQVKMGCTVFLLQSIAFIDLLAVSLIMPLISTRARALGAGHIVVGLLGSVYAGFQLFSGPFFGSLSDLKGRKSILMLTLVICGVSYSVLGLTSSVLVILLMRAILGIFKQTQMLNRAMVPDYESDIAKQSALHGKLAAISGVGMTLGPVIGGHILEDNPKYGFAYIGLIVGILFTLNAGLVSLLPQPNVKRKPRSRKRRNSATPLDAPHNIFKYCLQCAKESISELTKVEWSKFWQLFLLKGFIGFTMGVYYSNYSLYLKTVYGLSTKVIGYIISFQGVVGVLSSYSISLINKLYVDDEDCCQRNLHVFLLITLSIVGLILSMNVYIYILCLIPLAIGNAVGRLVTMEMIIKRGDVEHRGTLIGASNSVRSMTGVVSPMVAGFIAQYIGVSYVIFACFSSALIGTILSYYTRRKCINKRLKQD